jgi:outer membrane protein assembly factor BamB
MIFVTAGNGPGDRHALCVSLDAREREANGNKPAWETRKTFPYVPCMLAKGEHIYFVNDSGIAGCYVGRTGEKVWEQRLAVGNVSSSPLLIDGLIYIAGEEGGLAVFAAETTFKEVWSSQLDEGVMATPAVVDGRLLIRGRQHLYCFGKK